MPPVLSSCVLSQVSCWHEATRFLGFVSSLITRASVRTAAARHLQPCAPGFKDGERFA